MNQEGQSLRRADLTPLSYKSVAVLFNDLGFASIKGKRSAAIGVTEHAAAKHVEDGGLHHPPGRDVQAVEARAVTA
jgi:hypothetical protein